MELRVLQYYLTVVEEGNISRAAEKLHVSQPTISRQLHDLETELDTTLFTRGQRKIVLTPAGEYFADQATRIVALADKTVANIHQEQDTRGSITIGCAEVPMLSTIAMATKYLATRAPHVQVNVYSTDADDARERMQAGLFDFSVVMEPMDKSDYHFIHLPGATKWGVMLRRDNPLAAKSALTATDLLPERLIMTQQHTSRSWVRDWFGNQADQLNVVASYNLSYNASLLAAAGVGSVVCIDGIINTTDQPITFVPLTPTLTAKASFVWPKGTRLSPAADVFLKALRNVLTEADTDAG
ncbi:LysR family transcriptional regulator [Lacticaseibacillus pabuli]|uniref:LysR family transcriptional regulator n=1 Tax=Lacticaseibacillus pabuli TaxID=3025672 RepID=A0ABY7WW98_9LACO|nr:LysR family transcriptional regulator [Lacticaseibacillus sp. KACC 23028]WDF83271.1 LysR family transcriptional regulator [Lacticaseibacillus sp. KACC 23028]